MTATQYRKVFLSSFQVPVGDGPELQPQLYYKQRPDFYQITLLYSQIKTEDSENKATFNKIIRDLILDEKTLVSVQKENTLAVPNTLVASYSAKLLADRIISITFTTYIYLGGAHGLTTREAVLFDLAAGRRLDLRDILANPPSAISNISAYCADQLRRQAAADGWSDMLLLGTEPAYDPANVVRNVQHWSFERTALDILFDPYSVAAYAAGSHECHVGYPALASWLKGGSVVASLVPAPPAATLPSPTAPAPPPPTPSAPQHEKALADTGTAFAINAKGDFLTNHHVVKDCRRIDLVVIGSRQDAKIVADDERNDLSVVRASGVDQKPLQMRDGSGIRPADGVVTLGFPYAGLLASTPQITTGAVSALAGLHNDTRYLQITAPVQPGSSGGPLLDLSGNVVGVVAARINALAVAEATGTLPENINFAIKSSVVREFLDASGIDYRTAQSAAKLDPADIGEGAAKSTVLLECYK